MEKLSQFTSIVELTIALKSQVLNVDFFRQSLVVSLCSAYLGILPHLLQLQLLFFASGVTLSEIHVTPCVAVL